MTSTPTTANSLSDAEMIKRYKAITDAHSKRTAKVTVAQDFNPSTMLADYPDDGFVAQAYLLAHHPIPNCLEVNISQDISNAFINATMGDTDPEFVRMAADSGATIHMVKNDEIFLHFFVSFVLDSQISHQIKRHLLIINHHHINLYKNFREHQGFKSVGGKPACIKDARLHFHKKGE